MRFVQKDWNSLGLRKKLKGKRKNKKLCMLSFGNKICKYLNLLNQNVFLYIYFLVCFDDMYSMSGLEFMVLLLMQNGYLFKFC